LPASLLKTCFLDALTTYYHGIHFDPDDANVEIDPFVADGPIPSRNQRAS
jgi:hypothetical protein